MDEHIHSGTVVFLTTGLYAVLFIWGLRLVAAKLAEYEPTAILGKSLGALVHFG